MLARFLSRFQWYLLRSRGVQQVALLPVRKPFTFRHSFNRLLSSRFLFASGGTVGLAFSLFGPSKKDEKLLAAHKHAEPSLTEVIRESDALYDAYLIDSAYELLKRFGSGKNPELLWRLARVVCEKGKIEEDKGKRKALMDEALKIVLKALDNEGEDGCFGAHKWYAIILNYVGESEGTKERIKKSYEIRRHFEKALDLDGNDPTTWHLLGAWHFTFADMGTVTRMVAKTVFQTPPSSTYEEALKCFEKAEFISPDFYSRNIWLIAEVYDRLGKKATALEFYAKAFRMPVVTTDDKEVHDLATKKLTKAGIDIKTLSP